MRKILGMALSNNYPKKLFGINWNIYGQTFLKIVDTLQWFEPKIKAEAAKVKSNKDLANKV